MTNQSALPADELLLVRKRKLETQLKNSHQTIAKNWEALSTPPRANTKVQHWMYQAEKAVAVYDGFMLMYKLFNRYGKMKQIFKKRK